MIENSLSTICKGYEDKYIFNADGIGLFHCSMPSLSLLYRDGTRHEGKLAKEHMNVVLLMRNFSFLLDVSVT